MTVPRQIVVTGFNDLTGGYQMLPPLTTVRTPRDDIGYGMRNSRARSVSVAEPCINLGYGTGDAR